MSALRTKLAVAVGALLASILMIGGAVAAPVSLSSSPFGNASGSTVSGPGGFDFDLPAGGIEASQLEYVGTEYEVLDGSCGLGSPRYQLNVQGGGNVFIYIGEYNSVTGTFDCAEGDVDDTANLLESADPRCDFTQVGGAFYGDCGDLESVLGGRNITGIQLVVDYPDQTFNFDPTVVIDLGRPTSKDDCKNGGYAFFGFNNQGQCIQNVNTGS